MTKSGSVCYLNNETNVVRDLTKERWKEIREMSNHTSLSRANYALHEIMQQYDYLVERIKLLELDRDRLEKRCSHLSMQ